MIGMMLAAALASQDLSPEVQARIAPVQQAIDAELARQAVLPRPRNDAERLDRMGAMDQVGRRALTAIDLNDLPTEQQTAANAALWEPVSAVDRRLMSKLLKMVPSKGWFLQSVYGRQGAGAAFLIVQHSELEHWRRFVPVLEPLVATGEVEGQSYGLMYDRLAINEGRPQRYGTQMACIGGRWAIDYANLEYPENADARRQAMGFMQTLAEYETNFARYPACQED
ncbi:DUF6624 domain-containing protein [Brevundimonas staleyi]|uniref:DUF6624 domain-containing protein n=1 Tax=Brevundimonas staleyi TaxID=74326 RepID=A0ABW0FPN1_9CAUL